MPLPALATPEKPTRAQLARRLLRELCMTRLHRARHTALWAVRLIVGMSLLDALLTIGWVVTGRATEANPLWADLVETNPSAFLVWKMALVMAAGALFYRHALYRIARVGLVIGLVAYAGVLGYHARYGMKQLQSGQLLAMVERR